jgi:Protein of unknown function (DUF1348)
MSSSPPRCDEDLQPHCLTKNWEYDAVGLMQRRFACINDSPITE